MCTNKNKTVKSLTRPLNNHGCGKTQKRRSPRYNPLSKHQKMAEIMREACSHNENSNPLKPSSGQVMKLIKCGYNFNDMTIETWYHFLKENLLIDQLFTVRGGSTKKVSLTIRCQKLAKMLANSDGSMKHCYMMDGHGRTLFMLVEALLLSGISFEEMEGKIHVVDIDEYSHQWHMHAFPKGIDSIQSNIFHLEIPKSAILYLNFCGIGGCIEQTKSTILNRFHNTTMLSLSITKRFDDKAKKPLMMVNFLKTQCAFFDTIESDRGDGFDTYTM